MRVNVTGQIPVTGDCGHKFEVPIARMEEAFDCPVCGHEDRFTQEQIDGFKGQIRKAAGEFGAKEFGKALSNELAKSTRGLKHVHYRKK